jgi:hypothetical protein
MFTGKVQYYKEKGDALALLFGEFTNNEIGEVGVAPVAPM